jgi:hypothetical protein
VAAIWFAATAAAAVETSSSTGPAAALCTSDAVLVGLVAARAVTGALAGEPCPRARAAWKLQPLAAGMDNRQVIAIACLVELPQIACTQLHWGSRWHSEQTPQVQCATALSVSMHCFAAVLYIVTLPERQLRLFPTACERCWGCQHQWSILRNSAGELRQVRGRRLRFQHREQQRGGQALRQGAAAQLSHRRRHSLEVPMAPPP